METIFDKIISRSIPSYIVYEDDVCLVILDINPIRKGHLLVISKKSVATIDRLLSNELSAMMSVVQKADVKLREALNADAVNILINDGKDAGQEIPHVHMHVIPRFKGDGELDINKKSPYTDGEIKKYQEMLRFN